MDDLNRQILRGMAWERAKGEMKSILHTYYQEYPKYKTFREEMETFIETIESEGCID